MISFLIGIIEEKNEDSMVLDVSGVGYNLLISKNTFAALPSEGETVKVHTYMSVREDGLTLFGFSGKEERALFTKLTEVNGIGPKLALNVLSGMPISELVLCIVKEDLRALSSIKGLGKKTAERLCLELKDKLSPICSAQEETQTFDYDENAVMLATETLISLGVNKNEAYSLAKSCAGPETSAEEIISKALRGYRN